MSKTLATDFSYAMPLYATSDTRAMTAAQAYPQSLLDLPPGEARKSLLAVHEMLSTSLGASRLAIYEAGGGSTSFLPLNILNRAHVTVVDIDENQIRNNDYAQEKILGDIQTHRFAPESFDLVICYNVVEHLPDVESALLGFCESLKQGGLILIGAPNPKSLSGMVTKHTPHWFHVWFYRYVRGDKEAGLPGEAPFPTLLPSAGHAVEPRSLRQDPWPRGDLPQGIREPALSGDAGAQTAVRRPARCSGQRHQFPAAPQDRRPARRLSCDPAKALKHARNVVRSESDCQPSDGDALARRIRPQIVANR